MSPLPEASYDWTFCYELSRPIFCKESNDDDNIELLKDSGNNLKGFNIKVENEMESKARKISNTKAKKLERILITLSGMELQARLTGDEGVPKKPGLIRVGRSLTIRYDIEGWINKIDISDPHIGNIINQDVNPELEYLSCAVAHKSHGRYSESIKETFRVIDEEKSVKHYSESVANYNKYKCIRDILSHREGQQLRESTMKYFTRSFDPIRDAFDFKHYDGGNRIVIFDSDSPKTKLTLEQVATDLIRDIKNIIGL